VSANAAGRSTSINVGGNVTLDGGTVRVLADAGSYAPQTTYTILRSNGTLTGGFSGVTSNFAYLTPTLDYSAGTVQLTLALNDAFCGTACGGNNANGAGSATGQGAAGMTSAGSAAAPVAGTPAGSAPGFGSIATTRNQREVGAALTQMWSAGKAPVADALLSASLAQARAALTQIAGDEATALLGYAEQRTRRIFGAVAARVTPGQTTHGDDGWLDVSYDRGHVSGDDDLGSGATRIRAVGLSAGMDHEVFEQLRVGVALGYDNGNLDFSGRSADGGVNGAQAALYASYTPGPLFVNAVLGAGRWNNALDRAVAVGTLAGTPHASFATTGYALYTEAGWRAGIAPGMELQPYAGMMAGRYRQNAYDASAGGAFDLSVAGASQWYGTTVLGLRYVLTPQAGVAGFDLRADANWRHRLGSRGNDLNVSFANAATTQFVVAGTPATRDLLVVGLSGDVQVTRRASVYARVGAELGKHGQDYSALAGVNWKF
jgi:uncharacterized protein with beta-barrel porin domain